MFNRGQEDLKAFQHEMGKLVGKLEDCFEKLLGSHDDQKDKLNVLIGRVEDVSLKLTKREKIDPKSNTVVLDLAKQSYDSEGYKYLTILAPSTVNVKYGFNGVEWTSTLNKGYNRVDMLDGMTIQNVNNQQDVVVFIRSDIYSDRQI
jgi:hypothetical protein